MSVPFDPTNIDHVRVVRDAAEAAWALCGNEVEAAQQALLDHDIGLAPKGELGVILIGLQDTRRLLSRTMRRGR